MSILTKCFIAIVLFLIPLNSYNKFSNNLLDQNKSTYKIHKVLATMHLKEKIPLELLFRYLFSEDFAYVLFGHKPMAISGYYTFKVFHSNKIMPLYKIADSFYKTFHPQNKAIKNVWKMWKKKYVHLFPSSQCVFLEEPNPWNTQTNLIICINKKLFIDTVNLHKEDFKEVLKKDVNPEDLLNQCCKGKYLLTDILQKHDGLIGTLLGYGRNNSWLYYKRQISNSKEKHTTVNRSEKEIFDNLSAFAKEDCQKTWNNITKVLEESQSEIIDYSYIPQYMCLPTFVADLSSEETKQLEKTYYEDRKKIQEKYKNKDFLTVTFEQIFSDN